MLTRETFSTLPNTVNCKSILFDVSLQFHFEELFWNCFGMQNQLLEQVEIDFLVAQYCPMLPKRETLSTLPTTGNGKSILYVVLLQSPFEELFWKYFGMQNQLLEQVEIEFLVAQ